MNEDFEEEYDDDYDEGDALQDAYDKAKDAKEKYDKYKEKKSGNKNTNDPSQHNEAREFNKSQNAKNQARTQNPPTAQQAGSEVAKKGGEQAAKEVGKQAATQTAAQTTAAGAGTAAAGATAAGTTAAGAGTAAAGATAAGATAAGAGTAAAAGGAVAAQAAIPVAGWIALAIEAAIALTIAFFKLRKKHDKKMAENGIDTKGLRRLKKAAPLLFIVAIIILIILIIIILVQGETYDKVAFMQEAIKCFESADGCNDFMNTGWRIGNGIISVEAEPLIRKTDLEIAEFVVSYKIVEWLYFGGSRLELSFRYG